MAKSKKKKAKKAAKAVKAKKAPMKKSKAKKAKKVGKKKVAKKVVKAAKKAAPKKAPPKATAKKAAKKPAPKAAKPKMIGEGDYQASRTFLKDQAGFVKKNQAKIPAMGKQAEMALEGPEGDTLRAAEAEAASHSRAAE